MKTVYALTHGCYSDYGVQCLFENEADQQAAFARCGGEEGGYGMESFVLFDSVPEIITQHCLTRRYAPSGQQVREDHDHVTHTIITSEEDRRHALDKQVILSAITYETKDRNLFVTGPTLEACDKVHRHYADKIFSVTLGEYEQRRLEWPEGIE